MRGLLIATLALLLASSPVLAETSPVDQLAQYFSQTRTLTGEFVQTTRDESGAVLEQSTGTFVMARDQRFDWHYQTPWEQRIISDGEQLWVYDVDLAQVVVRPLAEAIGVGPAQLLSGDMNDLRKNFTLSPAAEGDAVVLTPRDEAWDFQRLRLELENTVPSRLMLRDGLGQVIEVQLQSLSKNQPLSAQQFSFTPPPGVDVLSGS